MSDPAAGPLAPARAPGAPADPRAGALLRPHPGPPPAGGMALLGLPYDGGIPTRPGARFGPRALREALGAFGSWDGARELPAVADLGDLELPAMNGAEAHRRIEAAASELFGSGATPLFLGGDHGCTGSVLRGLAAARPGLKLAVISIDAHLDVREYADEQSLSSGTPFRRALESGIVSGERMAMIGIRRFANARHYLDYADRQGILRIPCEAVEAEGAAAAAAAALRAVMSGADALYLSIDLDAADAAFAPGVSASGIGGLSAREMIALAGALAAHPLLIGADLMELSPPYDADGRTARLAARLALEILSARAAHA